MDACQFATKIHSFAACGSRAAGSPAGARGGCGRRRVRAGSAARHTRSALASAGRGVRPLSQWEWRRWRARRARCRRARRQRARAAAAALAPLAAAVLGRRRRHHLRRCRCNRRRPGVARAPRQPSRRVSNLSTSERGASAAMCGARATSVAASAARSTRAASSCGTRRCCSPGTSPSAHAAQWPACACASSVAAPHCLHLPRRSQALPRSSQQTATTRPLLPCAARSPRGPCGGRSMPRGSPQCEQPNLTGLHARRTRPWRALQARQAATSSWRRIATTVRRAREGNPWRVGVRTHVAGRILTPRPLPPPRSHRRHRRSLGHCRCLPAAGRRGARREPSGPHLAR